MANERLFQFPAKVSPVVTDIVYVGDSAAAFAEVQCTIAQILAAGYTATPTPSQFAGWDVNKNLSANAMINGYTTTATAAGTTTLTVGSTFQQYFTGSTTQTILLPVTSTLVLGQSFYIVNNSSGNVTVQSSGANTVQVMAANTSLLVTCILTSGTTAASWSAQYSNTSPLTLPLSLANGGTNAALVADNGAIVYSTGSALALLAHTTTVGLALLSGNNAAPSWSATAPLLTGGGTMAGNIAMGTNAITGLADPVNSQDAATKNYVDTIATGGAAPVQAATTANLTATYNNGTAGVGATLTNSGAQAAFAVDGYSASVGDRILVKNQSTNTQNGIYTVTVVGTGATNWVLTRATDYDTVSNINDTGLIPVVNGTVNAASGWFNTTIMVTIGTTAITYIQFTNVTYPISLAHGGTNANLTASNGGIFYSTASAGAILAGTATAGLALLSGASTTPTWSATPPLLTGGGTMTGNIAFNPSTDGITGTTAADNASAGTVGEFVSSVIAVGGAVSLSNGITRNITSISLTAGDWDVWGNIVFNNTGNNFTQVGCWTSSTSATLPDFSLTGGISFAGAASNFAAVCFPMQRFNVSSTTTVYASGFANFGSGTGTAYGAIYARRRR